MHQDPPPSRAPREPIPWAAVPVFTCAWPPQGGGTSVPAPWSKPGPGLGSPTGPIPGTCVRQVTPPDYAITGIGYHYNGHDRLMGDTNGHDKLAISLPPVSKAAATKGGPRRDKPAPKLCQLPDGVRTNRVVTEVPQFSTINFHGKLLQASVNKTCSP